MMRYLITILSSVLFFFAAVAQGEPDLPDNWRISPAGDSIKYTVYGANVYGHEFGFIKRAGSCDKDNLWVSWSTSVGSVEDLEGITSGFNIVTGDQSGHVVLELVLARKAFIDTSILFFTNMMAGEMLVRELSKEGVVKVSVVSPDRLLKMLDVHDDIFDVSGFVSVRKEVERMCLEMETSSQS